MNRNNPILIHMLILLTFLLVGMLMLSCKTVTVQPTIHTETKDSVRTEIRHDSIWIDRWHTIYTQGDTVFKVDSIVKEKYKLVYIHDSIDLSRIDTITQTIEIEKQGSIFWKGSGIAFWVLIGMIVLGITIGLIIKFAK